MGRSKGGPDPLPENSQNIGSFLSSTGLDSLKNRKATKPAFNVGHHRHASETPFGRPMTARLQWYLDHLFPTKKGHPLAKLPGSALGLNKWQ